MTKKAIETLDETKAGKTKIAMQMGKITTKVRGVGLSMLCSILLMATFFMLTPSSIPPFTILSVAASTDKADTNKIDTEKPNAPQANEAATIRFDSAAYTVNEAISNAEIILLVEPPISTPVTVTVSSGNIQAIAGSDFEGLRQSVVIRPNAPSYTVALTIFDDPWVEGDEQLRLTLGEYHGVAPGTITETLVTIQDNDVAYLSINDVAVNEEAEGVSLQIVQSVTSTLDSLVDVHTHEGSATTSEDFSALFTTVSIPSGSTEATVTVQITDDELVESTEYFFVTLEDATNAEIANITATVTISDDDTLPQILVETAEANEADGLILFPLTLSSTWAQTVTVEYSTLDGSALATSDYLTSTGVVTIAPGALTATVAITLVDDQLNEPDERLFLALANPTQATLSSDVVEGIIQDDDSDGGFNNDLFLPGLHGDATTK